MQKFLGVVREAWAGTSSCRGLRLTQSDYTAKILEDAVKLGFGPILFAPLLNNPSHRLIPSYCQNNRAILECARAYRKFVVPVTLHTFRSFARLARFVPRWCEWARKGIRYILGFVAHSADWSLIVKSGNDDWEEELRLSTFCDASFGTRCFGGYKVKLTEPRGSPFLIEWASRWEVPQSTSSTESGLIEWRQAAKAMLRVKGALDTCRSEPVPCDGYVDNDALRMASRGSSAKLGHLHVHADTCFRFLAQPPSSLHRVSTTENEGHTS